MDIKNIKETPLHPFLAILIYVLGALPVAFAFVYWFFQEKYMRMEWLRLLPLILAISATPILIKGFYIASSNIPIDKKIPSIQLSSHFAKGFFVSGCFSIMLMLLILVIGYFTENKNGPLAMKWLITVEALFTILTFIMHRDHQNKYQRAMEKQASKERTSEQQ